METSGENWESFGGSHGCWRIKAFTRTLGELTILVHPTSDRSSPTAKQQKALSAIYDLAYSKCAELAILIQERYGVGADDFDWRFDLAEIPLIDLSPSTYFHLECDTPDDENRLTVLFRNEEILGVVDRDAASKILEWDAIDQLESLASDNIGLDDADDD